MRQFDLYRRVPKDLTEGSLHGAIVSIVVLVFACFLIVSNVADYLSVSIKSEMLVEEVRKSKLKINVDIVFPKIPCGFLTLDATDVMGSHELDTKHALHKLSLAEDGFTVLHSEEVKDNEGEVIAEGLNHYEVLRVDKTASEAAI